MGYICCRFNTTSVAAAWVSTTELNCIAPAHATGMVSVELTMNEQQHSNDGTRFEFEAVAAYSVYPVSGPVLGGTMVEVRGSSIALPDARGLFCQFGGADAVAATHSSRELVQCVAPPSVEGLAGAVAVRLVNNDAVYSVTVAFTYRPAIEIERIHIESFGDSQNRVDFESDSRAIFASRLFDRIG